MHLKILLKKVASIALILSLSMSDLTMVNAADATTGTTIENDVIVEDNEEKHKNEEKIEKDEKPLIHDEEKDDQGNIFEGNKVSDSDSPLQDDSEVSDMPLNNQDIEEGKDVEESENDDEKNKAVADGEEDSDTERFKISKAQFTDNTETEYEFELSNCDLSEDEKLLIDVWSVVNGKDDVKRIPLERRGEKEYGIVITIADFKSAGEYIIQVVHKSKDNTENIIEESKFNVQELSEGTALVEKQVYEEGTARIKIDVPEVASGVKNVSMAIWSREDQSDIYWYEATHEETGWYVDMNIANHNNNWGVYVAHTYAQDGNGFQKYVGGIRAIDFSVKTIPAMVEINEENGIAEITISDEQLKIPGKLSGIQCAVWSETNGQDDVVWYELKHNIFTKKWSKEVPLTALNSVGLCYVHAYGTKLDKSSVFLGGAQFRLEAPSAEKVEAVVTDYEEGKYKVTVQNIKSPLGIQEVSMGIWCNADQSDMKWYTAKKQNDGNYVVESDIISHKGSIGIYKAHVYVKDALGINTFVGGTTIEFESEIGDLSVKEDPRETTYVVELPVNKYPGKLKEVSLGVWSNANGQDDLQWYVATRKGNIYQATIDIRKHHTSGSYAVHAYGKNAAGQSVILAGAGELFSVKGKAQGTIAVTDKNESKGTAKIKVENLDAPSGISSVSIGIWSQANQSDMHWYSAKKQDGRTWTVEMNVAEHNYNGGTYFAHAYAKMGNQIEEIVSATTFKLEPKNVTYVLNNLGKGKRTIGISGPSDVKDLQFGVWSTENGTDDLVWYKANKGTAGNWNATVLGQNHKSGGIFNVHVYSGSNLIAGTTFWMDPSEVAKNGWYYEKLNGKTYKLYYVNGKMQKDVSNIIGRQSSYMAEINRKTCTVTIYAKDGANGYIIPVIAFTCSVGLPATPTPVGRFYTLQKYRWSELMGPSYGQYCTRIVGGILFHSVAGSHMSSYNLSAANYNMLGQPASHGCVRLCVRDAKWIYDNCSLGMEVNIFDSSYPGPFGKPATIKIPANQNWDPTDPNI